MKKEHALCGFLKVSVYLSENKFCKEKVLDELYVLISKSELLRTLE